MKKAIFIFSICFIFNAYADECAEDVVRCGTTKDGFTWTISNIKDENNNDVILPSGKIAQELSIQGTGDMKDYTRNGEGIAPWKNPDHPGGKENSAPTITSIVIGEGITSIGVRAFEDMKSVTNITLPEGLKKIGTEAFLGCPISEIHLPDSLEELKNYAFYGARISNIELPESLEKIGSFSFGETNHLLNITIPENTTISPSAFIKEGGEVFIQNVYCSGANESCQALKNRESMNGRVQFYESNGNGYFYNNKWYANVHDIGTPNYIKKRIYTIDEANKVAGDKNRVSIRYR